MKPHTSAKFLSGGKDCYIGTETKKVEGNKPLSRG